MSSARWSNLRFHAPPLLALLVGVAVAFSAVLGPDRGLFFRDHTLVFRPRWWAVHEALTSLRLPLVTHGPFDKVPLDNLLNGTYTPGALLLFLPFDLSYDLLVVFHFALLGLGAYLLAIELGAHREEALLASAIAALSGPAISQENLIVNLISLAYAPWVLLALRRILVAPNARHLALLGMFTGFQLQAILPEIAILDLAGGAVIASIVRPRITGRLVASLSGATALALSISAIQLFPALAALTGSERGAGFTYEMVSGWSLSPGTFIELLAPSFWAPPELPYVNAAPITGNHNDPPYFTTLYFGCSLGLVIAGALHRRARLIAGLTFFFLLIAMGRHTPVHRLFVALPFLDSSRYAVKYMLLVAAGAACLAPMALRELTAAPKRALAGAAALTAAVLILASTVWSDLWADYLQVLLQQAAARWGHGEDQLPKVVELARQAMEIRVVLALLASLLLLSLIIASRTRPALVRAIPLVVTLDLALGAAITIPSAELETARLPDEAAQLIEEPRPNQIFVEPGISRALDLPPPEGWTSFEQNTAIRGARGELARTRRFEDDNVNRQSNPLHTAIYAAGGAMDREASLPLLARVGVQHLFTWRELAMKPLVTYRGPHETENLYRVPQARSYVSAYRSWRSSPSRSFSAVRTFLLDPAQLTTALIVGAPELESSTSTACEAPQVKLVAHNPSMGEVEVEVRGACPSMVVLQELHRPEWEAEVDGRSVQLFEADAGYLAVQVAEGTHAVRFRYHSSAYRWGMLSAAALLLALALISFSRGS